MVPLGEFLKKCRTLGDDVFLETYPHPFLLAADGLDRRLDSELERELAPLDPRAGLQRLGRGQDAEILVGHPSVSSLHAQLDGSRGEWQITDLASTNGTIVQGELLTPGLAHPLKDGDLIQLGGVSLHFLSPEQCLRAVRKVQVAHDSRGAEGASRRPRSSKTSMGPSDTHGADPDTVRTRLGSLNDTPVRALFEEIASRQLSGRLELTDDEARWVGSVTYRLGDPWRARTKDGGQGVAALTALRNLESGRYLMSEEAIEGTRQIHLTFAELLLSWALRRLGQAQAEGEVFLQAVLDAVPDAIVVCNAEGFVLKANASAELQLGHTEAELLGQRFSELLDPEHRSAFLERLKDDGLVGQTLALQGQTASGLAVPFEAAFNRLEVRGQQHLVASLRDVSERS